MHIFEINILQFPPEYSKNCICLANFNSFCVDESVFLKLKRYSTITNKLYNYSSFINKNFLNKTSKKKTMKTKKPKSGKVFPNMGKKYFSFSLTSKPTLKCTILL